MREERANNEHLLLLDSGDALAGGEVNGRITVGDQYQGAVIVDAMNLLAYDAMALGPEELALGRDVLNQRLMAATFPILSANAVRAGGPSLVTRPFAVLDVAGHRIGVLGLTRQPERPLPDFEVQDPVAALERYLPEVSRQAETVVVLTNVPYETAKADLAGRAGIDLLVAGRPDWVPGQAESLGEGGGLAVTAEKPVAGHTGRRIGRLVVTVEPDGSLTEPSWSTIGLDPELTDDPAMSELLARYPD